MVRRDAPTPPLSLASSSGAGLQRSRGRSRGTPRAIGSKAAAAAATTTTTDRQTGRQRRHSPLSVTGPSPPRPSRPCAPTEPHRGGPLSPPLSSRLVPCALSWACAARTIQILEAGRRRRAFGPLAGGGALAAHHLRGVGDRFEADFRARRANCLTCFSHVRCACHP